MCVYTHSLEEGKGVCGNPRSGESRFCLKHLFQNSSGWEEEWGVFLEVRALHPGITTAPSAGRWGLGTATFQPQELEDEILFLSLSTSKLSP